MIKKRKETSRSKKCVSNKYNKYIEKKNQCSIQRSHMTLRGFPKERYS